RDRRGAPERPLSVRRPLPAEGPPTDAFRSPEDRPDAPAAPGSRRSCCARPRPDGSLSLPRRPDCAEPSRPRSSWPLRRGAIAEIRSGPTQAQNATRAVRRTERPSSEVVSGDVLLSHAVARAVPSALRGLASGFGMGPGVSLSLWSPKLYGDIVPRPVGADRTSGTAQWTRARMRRKAA